MTKPTQRGNKLVSAISSIWLIIHRSIKNFFIKIWQNVTYGVKAVFHYIRKICKAGYSLTEKILHKLHAGEYIVNIIIAGVFFLYLAVSLIAVIKLFNESREAHSGFLGFWTFLISYTWKHLSHDVLHGILTVLHIFTLFYVFTFVLNTILANIGDPNIWYKKIKADELKGFLNPKQANSTGVNAKQLSDITNMGVAAFGENNISRKEREGMYNKWYEKNNNVFEIIYDDNTNKIGFIAILPMIESSYKKYISNKLSQFGIDENDITSNNSNHIYIQAVYLKEEFQNDKTNYGKLMRAVMYKIANLTQDIDKLEIAAEAFTPHGVKILRRLEFKKIKTKTFARRTTYNLNAGWDKPFTKVIKEAHTGYSTSANSGNNSNNTKP